MTKVPEAPRRSRRSLAWKEARLAAVDFEATGLDLARDTIISFGVVPIDDGMIKVGGSTYELVDPLEVRPSPKSITVHMLRPSDLAGALPLDAALERLSTAIAGRFLVTWRAWVDTGFLAKAYGVGAKGWLKRSIDVQKLAAHLAREEDGSDITMWSLTGVAERYSVPVADPHNALDDALVTAQLFLVVATRLAARGHRTIRQLSYLGQGRPPTLLRPRAPF